LKWGVGCDLAPFQQPRDAQWHRNTVRIPLFLPVAIALVLGALTACVNSSPDQIRQKTAEETAAIKRDTKAVAQGLKDGLSNKRAIDLNKGTRQDLESLPGISAHQAERIMAERPFANTHQLVTRRILTEDQYSQIQDRVVVTR
jgi:DNA uptake protein ComE-like DNA-binding protein